MTMIQKIIWNTFVIRQDEIEQVILVGGSTRVPKVQDVLLKAVGKYVFAYFLPSCLTCSRYVWLAVNGKSAFSKWVV